MHTCHVLVSRSQTTFFFYIGAKWSGYARLATSEATSILLFALSAKQVHESAPEQASTQDGCCRCGLFVYTFTRYRYCFICCNVYYFVTCVVIDCHLWLDMARARPTHEQAASRDHFNSSRDYNFVNQPILLLIMKQYPFLAKHVLWRNARFYAC